MEDNIREYLESLEKIKISIVMQVYLGDYPTARFDALGRFRRAIKSFENNWTTENTICTLYYLDLLKHRDVSNEIAQLTGVLHQSPQVIVIKGSEIVYSESHGSIDVRRIEQKLKLIYLIKVIYFYLKSQSKNTCRHKVYH
mgnify:CR=1 FL=1